MTRTARAALLADRHDEDARALRSAAARAGDAAASADLRRRAAIADRRAAEWRAEAAAEALREEGRELRECCLADISDPCTPECDCPDCQALRAADDDGSY